MIQLFLFGICNEQVDCACLAVFTICALPAAGGPLLNQVQQTAERNKTKDSKGSKRRGVAAGLGLTAASLLATQSADAATEVAQVQPCKAPEDSAGIPEVHTLCCLPSEVAGDPCLAIIADCHGLPDA